MLTVKGWHKLFCYLKPYLGLYTIDLFFALLESIATLSIPFIISYLLDNVVSINNSHALDHIIWCGLVMLAASIIIYWCDFYIVRYGYLVGAYIERDMRKEIFTHYRKLSCDFYDNQEIGELMSRVTVDLYNFSELFHRGSEETFIAFIKYSVVFFILSQINWWLAIATVTMVVPIAIFSYYYVIKIDKAYMDSHQKIAEINSQISDSLSGVRLVKSFFNENLEIEKFSIANNRFVSSKKRLFRIMSQYYGGVFSMTSLMTPIVAICGALIITNGEVLKISDLIMFLLYVGVLVDPINRLLGILPQLSDSIAGYSRFLEILDIKPSVVEKKNSINLKKISGHIEFKDVCFRYAPDKIEVLSGLNLDIKAGSCVALVGASGAGKTTLCSLILRFYDVTHGEILIDGKDIKEVSLSWLRKQIGFIQQDPYLFSESLFENIKYGRVDATEEEVIEAAKKSYLHEFITSLPNGYKTVVGERGALLSGGQRQRISIARVFLKNPSLLILDEATSSLDNESEFYIHEALNVLTENKTTIVIAHRLSTIRNAERIIVLSDGKIYEDGTHSHLLNNNGIYSKYYNIRYGHGMEI
jgi:ATP-binding cassette subfamily B protein